MNHTDIAGTWRFDEDIASNFVDHIQRSIPFYNELQDDVVKILNNVLTDNSIVIDIGGATGETISRINENMPQKCIKYFYIDNSSAMLKKAKDNLKDVNYVTYFSSNIETLQLPKSDAIIMLYTMQFVPFAHRLPTLKKIYDSLKPGGILILSEKVSCKFKNVEMLFCDLLHNIKINNGFTESEIHHKQLQLQNVLMPLSTDEYLTMLQQIGFNEFDIFFKSNSFVGFIAFK